MLFALWNFAPFEPRILAVAVAVYAILQAVKRYFPAITAHWAVLSNVVLTVLGVVVAVPSGQLFTLPTLTSIIVTSLAAAGMHGTLKNGFGVDVTPQPTDKPKEQK